MLDIPQQSKEGIQQLGIDIKTKLQHKPLSEAPLVLETPTSTMAHIVKLMFFVFICGCVAGIGYLLVTNPASLLSWIVGIWESLLGVIH